MPLNCLKNNERVNIYGVDIINADYEEVINELEEKLKSGEKTFIATPNTEIVMEVRGNRELTDLINSFDIVIPDGIGLVKASEIRKKPLKERVTGADVSNGLLEIANRESYSLFLLGAEEGIAQKAAKNISGKYPNIKIAGTHHGFFRDDSEVVPLINADILFVGLGFAKQEYFLYNNREKLDCKVAIGNGGMMNIYAGEKKRAPEFFQKAGLEWFYRLIKEPNRIKRQWKLPFFLLQVRLDKNSVK